METQKVGRQQTSTEVTFEVRDRELFFVHASAVADCAVELERMVHRSDGRLLEYFTVEGAPPDGVLEEAEAASAIDDARVVRSSGSAGLYEFVVSGPCIGATLADAGAMIREVRADEGLGRVVADVPPHADTRRTVETVEGHHVAEVASVRRRDRPAPEFTPDEFREALVDRLTDRQLEILRTAYGDGYFNWPRDSTAQEIASALEITQPTFAEHLRAGQRKLLRAVLDEADVE